MPPRKPRTRTLRILAGLLLIVTVSAHAADPPSDGKPRKITRLPGRNADSNEPWGAFLGKAAHLAIAHVYLKDHPDNDVFHNTIRILDIMRQPNIGDPSLLLREERDLRPDITDTCDRVLFEIKPDTATGPAEGRAQAQLYLRALNRALVSGRKFVGGTGLQGAHLIQFEAGLYVWQLSWRTPEPGVTLYRWRRSRDMHPTGEYALEANAWVEPSEEEIQQHEQMMQQVMQALLDQRPAPAEFCGQVLRVKDPVPWVAPDCPAPAP